MPSRRSLNRSTRAAEPTAAAVSKAAQSQRDQVVLDGLGDDESVSVAAVARADGEAAAVVETVPPPPPTSRLANIYRLRPTPFIIGLFVLAVLYTMRLASDLLIPIVIALLLDFLLSPLIRRLNRRGLPNVVGAALVGLTLFGGIGVTVTMLAGPASEWIGRAPQSLAAVETRMRRLAQPIARLQETTSRVQKAVTASEENDTPEVTVASPSLLSRMTGQAASLGAALLTVVFLTFFLLASGDLFMSRVIESIPQFSDKKKAVRIAREVEDGISRYLVTVTLINTGLGLATWGVLYLLGMPNAMLWGVMAGVLNFIPYIGAMITVLVIGVAAIATFESTSQALMMPLAFLGLNTLEANLFTPMVMGRQFPLNSVAIFVGLLFWFYLWGIPGALLAVPLMVALNVCCDHIEKLKPYGAFLKNEVPKVRTG